jgi:ribosomal protein L16
MLQKNQVIYKIKVRSKKYSRNNIALKYGIFGLKALSFGRVTIKQLEIVRKHAVSFLGRRLKLWFFIFANSPITRKPKAVRMGKGKGSFYLKVCCVSRGKIIFEIFCKIEKTVNYFVFLRKLQKLLTVKTKLVINK